MAAYLGRIGKFSVPEQRLLMVLEEMAELRQLFEEKPRNDWSSLAAIEALLDQDDDLRVGKETANR